MWLAIGTLFAFSGRAARRLRPGSRLDLGLAAMSLVTVASDLNTGLQLPSGLPGRGLTVLVGVPAFWLQMPLICYLLLSYPSGRIDRPGERLLVRTATAFAAVASLVLLATKTPVPLCAQWCGPSPVQLVDNPSLYLQLRGLALLLTLALAAGGVVLLLRRTRTSPRERRRSFVTTAISLAAVLLLAGIVADIVLAYASHDRATSWDATFALLAGTVVLGALPLLFVTGLAQQRLAFAVFGDLLPRAGQVGASALETAIARATGDPMLRIAYRTPDGWKDATGRLCTLPDPASAPTVDLIGHPPRAALIHSPALAEETGLFRSALSLIEVAFPPPSPVDVAFPPPSRDQEPQPMPPTYAFLSYLRDDAATVDRLADALRTHGIEVWLDRTHLVVGDRWPLVIRKAIRDGAYFIACFSPAYANRPRTYMNEELITAVEELRLRPRDRRWFLPVTLEPCTVPALDLGAGETLEQLHHVDLSDDWDHAVRQLVRAMKPD